MHVHVPETRDQKLPSAVHDLRARRSLDLLPRADRYDLILLDHDGHTGLGRLAGGVDHRYAPDESDSAQANGHSRVDRKTQRTRME